MNPEQALLQRICQIWEAARYQAARSVNSAHVCANWLIGQQIVEAEQRGAERAEYGAKLLENLAQQLLHEYGSGFSVSSLKYMRLFYLGYPNLLPIRHAVRDELEATPKPFDLAPHLLSLLARGAVDTNWEAGRLHPHLSWTHYRALLKVDRVEARSFYEIEAIKNGWSARQLERQINSLLFDRLLKSRDQAGVLALANEGLIANKPSDLIKDPYVLEFLDLPESHRLVEAQLEEALLTQLQAFLLELGSGFAFVGRQVRLTLDGEHFYADLVFYHIKLKCYIIIDLKVGKLTHADLGQMQLYVHYYDREIIETTDNPTIGLILCTDKNDAVVQYVLAEANQQIFASRYQFHLPSEEALRQELAREVARLEP
ncbi:MAG: PDDEXK nuclease domain-containing protein [Caldilineaceae bacterium]